MGKFIQSTNPIFVLVMNDEVVEVETFFGEHPFIAINYNSFDNYECPICNNEFYESDYGAGGVCDSCGFSLEKEENVMMFAKDYHLRRIQTEIKERNRSI